MSAIEGGCLCGAVRYSASAHNGGGHCFCVDCRKTSGTSHGSHMMVPGDGFTKTGELKFFDKSSDAGNTVSRGFCPNCGSAVYSINSAMPGAVFVRASSLDDPDVFEPRMIVYASRAPGWSKMNQSLPTFAEMPSPEETEAALP